MLAASLLRSLFLDSNTPQHYEALGRLLLALLRGSPQEALLVLLPLLFYLQTFAVQQLLGSNAEELLQFVDSEAALAEAAEGSGLPSPTAQPGAMFLLKAPLDTLASEEEEDEEEEEAPQAPPEVLPTSETSNEIPILPQEAGAVKPVESPEEIKLGEAEAQEGLQLPRPAGVTAHVLALQLQLLLAVATEVRSEDLERYLRTVGARAAPPVDPAVSPGRAVALRDRGSDDGGDRGRVRREAGAGAQGDRGSVHLAVASSPHLGG